MHPSLIGEEVALAGVAAGEGREHVGPAVRAPAGQRHQVVAREALARPQLPRRPPAELAAVVVAREEEGVGDLAAEAAGDVAQPYEANDGGARRRQGCPTGTRGLP